MGDLSPHFSRTEFMCKCGCLYSDVYPELIEVLEAARTHFGVPITINSGCRCKKHNAEEGGAKDSQHLYGTAADVVVQGINADVVADYFESEYPMKYGIGRYNGRTHIDIRPGKARWDERS